MSDLLTSVKVRGDKAPYVQSIGSRLAAATQVAALEFIPGTARPAIQVAGRLVSIWTLLGPLGSSGHCHRHRNPRSTQGNRPGIVLQDHRRQGLHVVTPLSAGKVAVAWPVARNFAHIICAQMVQAVRTSTSTPCRSISRSGRSSWTTCAMTGRSRGTLAARASGALVHADSLEGRSPRLGADEIYVRIHPPCCG
jgi:hypothetical protein